VGPNTEGNISTCLIWDIFVCSGNIHHQNLKLYEIVSNFACFWPQNFLWRIPKLLELHYKIQLPIMMQNFAAIGQCSSEIPCEAKENFFNCAVNISLLGTTIPGGLISVALLVLLIVAVKMVEKIWLGSRIK